MSNFYQFCVSSEQFGSENPDRQRERSDTLETEDSETALSNSLIQTIDRSFFQCGEIDEGEIHDLVERLGVAFEQGIVSDDELMYALRYEHSALTKFLLTLSISTREESKTAIRCLAFAGNIEPDFWYEFVDDDFPQHFKYLLNALHVIPKRVNALLDIMKNSASTTIEGRYVGFDKRDVADYFMQGYDDLEAEEERLKAQRAEQEELIMTYLLVLTQFVYHRNEMLEVYIENDRDYCREIYDSYSFSIFNESMKARNEANHNDEITKTTTESAGSEIDNNQNSSSSSSSSNPWSNSIVKYDSDHVGYKHVLQHLVSVAQQILDVTTNIFEDGYQQCLKALVALNAQFPMLDHQSTEVVDMFIREELKRSDGGTLSQGLMYLLNENGFPNMSTAVAIAALKFCYQLMNHKFCAGEDQFEENDSSRGHFYSNDVKVLVDIAVRELTNIPADSDNEQLRMGYINLLEGIIGKTTWSTATDYYKKDMIIAVLYGIMEHDTESCRTLVEEILFNFPYLQYGAY